MRGSFPLGRIAGIGIRLHFTFPLLVAWIAWMGAGAAGWSGALWSAMMVLLLFLCVVLHELGHCLAAMAYGIPVGDITLLPIGGVAAIRKFPEKPIQEFVIALAGPAVNLVIFLVASLAVGFPVWEEIIPFPVSFGECMDALVKANLILVVFNLIPAFPMDGGRVLRSLLAMVLSYTLATRVAVLVGRVGAVAFVLLGLRFNPFLAVIGIFIFVMAGMEQQAVLVKHRLEKVRVRDIMRRTPFGYSPMDIVRPSQAGELQFTATPELVLLDGRLVGILPPGYEPAMSEEETGVRFVQDLMNRHFIALKPDTELVELFPDLWLMKQQLFPVIQDDRLEGTVLAADLGKLAGIRPGLRSASPRPGAGRWSVDLG